MNRPHAGACGDEDDLCEAIIDHVEQQVGGPLGPGVESLILSMLARGAAPKAIINAAVAYDDPWARGA